MEIILNEILKDHLKNGQEVKIEIGKESALEDKRWETILTKEPETIEWIRNFTKDSVFIDIGANIGVFTLTACISPVSRIIAFEPFTPNYISLLNNIRRNNIDKVFAFNCGISDCTSLVELRGKSLITGAAEFSYSKELQNNSAVSTLLPFSVFEPLADSNKDLFIKIDVDGAEMGVLHSLEALMRSTNNVSLLIESDTCNEKEVESFMTGMGFRLDQYFESFRPHSITRRLLEAGNTARNHVYSKNLSYADPSERIF